MAIRPSAVYPGQTDTSDPDAYPHGAAQNVTIAGDGIGTPLEKTWVNDLWGFLQAILTKGGVNPSDTPDTAEASDYLDGLQAQLGHTVQVFTSDDTYTKPLNASHIEVLCVGGGGGGRAGAPGTASGGGGGGGALSRMSFPADLVPAGSLFVKVGAAGTGGVSPTNGGSSYLSSTSSEFGVPMVSAPGGFAAGDGAPRIGGSGGGSDLTLDGLGEVDGSGNFGWNILVGSAGGSGREIHTSGANGRRFFAAGGEGGAATALGGKGGVGYGAGGGGGGSVVTEGVIAPGGGGGAGGYGVVQLADDGGAVSVPAVGGTGGDGAPGVVIITTWLRAS